MRPSWSEHQALANDRRPGAWPRMQYEAIQTGRTTRMMKEVLRVAAGSPTVVVYVVVPTVEHGKQLHHQFKTPLNVIYNTFSGLQEVLDLFTGSIKGAPPGRIEVFMDHAAIEHMFGHVLLQLHRFDEVSAPLADKFGNYVP